MKPLVYLTVTIALLIGLLPGAAAAQAPTVVTLVEQLPTADETHQVTAVPSTDPGNPWAPGGVADDFTLTESQSIKQVQFWAAYPNLPTTTSWTVIFHADARDATGNHIPGSAIDIRASLYGSLEVTGLVVPGETPYPVYLFTLDLYPPLTLAAGTYWIEIGNEAENSPIWWAVGSVDTSGRSREGIAIALERPGVDWNAVPGYTALALRLLGEPAPTYYIAGLVFEDYDQNGTFDYEIDGWTNIAWTVQLDQGCDGTVDQTAVQAVGDSGYKFAGLTLGECYRISEIEQAGWQQTTTLANIQSLTDSVDGVDIGNWYPSITITPEAPVGCDRGVYCEQQFGIDAASTGEAPYTFALIDSLTYGTPSVLPTGMELSSSGLLSGTPAETGRFLINVQATDSNGATGFREYNLIVTADASLTLTSSPNPAVAGQPVALTLSASGTVPTPDGPTPPVGEVTFSVNGTAISGCEAVTLNYSPDGSEAGDYPAVCTTSSLAAGSHLIRAEYASFGNPPGWHNASADLFVTVGAGAAITGQDVTSGVNPSATSGMETASGTGSGTLVVANYEANPGGTPTFTASDTYFDVYAAPGNNFTGVTIRACGMAASDKLFWWNSTSLAWVMAQTQSYDSGTGCITLQVNASSSPTVSQLTGTYFATGEPSGSGYQFIGFSEPVNNPDVLNSAKAGQSIPLKWRLLDASGAPVTNLTTAKVTVVSLACSLGTTMDAIEEYAAGASGLQNLGNGYYQYNWQTPKTYANSCKTMKLDISEGVGKEHTALFKFTK